MISLHDIGAFYGEKVLFQNVSLQFTPNNKYGLLGANGAGKSTLLRYINGEAKPIEGIVNVPSDVRIGSLKQDQFLYQNEKAINVVLQGRENLWQVLKEKETLLAKKDLSPDEGMRLGELEMLLQDYDGYQAETKAEQVLLGLGIDKPDALIETFSSGYRLRILLAQCLFSEPDCLLLDEPTNHLDINSIVWLENYLASYSGTLLLISHDHDFIKNICNYIVDIDYQEARLYKGNYLEFLKAKEENVRMQEAQIQQQEKKKEQLEDFVTRFKAKASKARQANSKLKQIERMDEIVIKQTSRHGGNFQFQPTQPTGKVVLTVENLAKSYGEKKVLEDISFTIDRGEKLFIIGPNGIGKSTLLKVVMGLEKGDAGSYEWGHNVEIGYSAQDHATQIPMNTTAYEWLYQFKPSASISEIRGLLGRLLFKGDDVHKKTSALSGGELVMLTYSRFILEKPNCLLLDEPTNHLDLEKIDGLQESLAKYEGTVVCVSHNRHFIHNLATAILEITPSGIVYYKGTYQEYLTKYGKDYLQTSLQQVTKERAGNTAKKQTPKIDFKQKKQYESKIRQKEKQISQLEKKLQAIDKALSNTDLYVNGEHEKVQELSQQQKEVKEQLDKVTKEWLEVQTEYEQLI